MLKKITVICVIMVLFIWYVIAQEVEKPLPTLPIAYTLDPAVDVQIKEEPGGTWVTVQVYSVRYLEAPGGVTDRHYYFTTSYTDDWWRAGVPDTDPQLWIYFKILTSAFAKTPIIYRVRHRLRPVHVDGSVADAGDWSSPSFWKCRIPRPPRAQAVRHVDDVPSP